MPTTAEIYGYGILANVICCVCSLGGAVILPCARRFSSAYHVFLSIFLGLAVGTLFTGAIVHLMPEALGLHGHSEDDHNETEAIHEEDLHAHSEFHVETYVWYLLIVLCGTYAFFLLEMIMTIVKKKRGYIPHNDEIPDEPELVTAAQRERTNSYQMNGIIENGVNEEKDKESTPKQAITPLAIMIIVGDAIHNTTDGLALAAAFTNSISDGISLTIAIFCHELPQELGDFAVLLNSGLSFKKALLANLFSSLTAIIGFIVGAQVSSDETARQWIFAITAGNFLYIALVDMLPELKRLGSGSVKTFIYHNIGILLGALILVVIAVFEEHIHV